MTAKAYQDRHQLYLAAASSSLQVSMTVLS